MNSIERTTVERIIGCTANIIDRHKCLAAIAYGKKRCCELEVREMILKARFSWIDWIAVTQRKWQSYTRNQNKAIHHDSVELREKYVRCHV